MLGPGDHAMKRLFLFLVAIVAVGGGCSTGKWSPSNSASQKAPDNLVLVPGGTFKNTNSNYFGKGVTLPSFCIGKYEVTQKEWIEVIGSNPSKFQGDNLPVETVSWYDCVEYCNKRSLKEGLNRITLSTRTTRTRTTRPSSMTSNGR